MDRNELQLPIITICGEHQFLLDTGSEEVWLADLDCRNCARKTAVCPHIGSKGQSVQYFRGSVRGDFVYFKSCLGTNKIICVKESDNMQNIQSHGILGLRGNSTGRNFIKNMLEQYQVGIHSVGIYYGLNEGRVFLGGCPEHFKKEKL